MHLEGSLFVLLFKFFFFFFLSIQSYYQNLDLRMAFVLAPKNIPKFPYVLHYSSSPLLTIGPGGFLAYHAIALGLRRFR